MKCHFTTESDWFYYSVKEAYKLGLVDGTTETTYSPKDNMTYAQTIKLASCMHQLYTQGNISLANGQPWYQSYVDYAKQNGIIINDVDVNDINALTTREDYACIFAHALSEQAYSPINTVSDNAIPDYKTTDTYGPEVYKLYRAGILSGSDGNGSFKPQSYISRAEVAAVVSRMMSEDYRKTFTNLQYPNSSEWVYGGYEASPPHCEYEVMVVNGVKTDTTRYTGTYKDYGTQFRLLNQCPKFYYSYGQVGMEIRFANRSDKPIKYMTVSVTPYNRVNDALAYTEKLTFTGPFYKPTINTDWGSDYYYWYKGYYEDFWIKSDGTYYSNGENHTISPEQISGVYHCIILMTFGMTDIIRLITYG